MCVLPALYQLTPQGSEDLCSVSAHLRVAALGAQPTQEVKVRGGHLLELGRRSANGCISTVSLRYIGKIIKIDGTPQLIY